MMADKPFWQRVALWGVGSFLVSALIVAVAGLISDPGVLVFALILCIPGLIAGAAIMFWRKWGLLIGFILSVVGFLFFSEGIPTGLGAPSAFFDFTTNLFGIFGLALMLIGCGIGFWQTMKGTLRIESNASVTKAIVGVLGVIVILSVISAVLTATNLGGVSAADKQGAEFLVAKKTKYDRDSIPVKASGTTKIVVKNKDAFLHTFTVEDLGIDEKLGPGEEKLIEISGASAGDHYFKCKISGHEEDMHGNLQAK